MSSFLSPLLRGSAHDFVLQNVRTGATVADRILIAFDAASRGVGLLGRRTFPAGEALIIAPTNAIHTFFMKFPIDVAFVTKDGRVVKVSSTLVPWRIAAAFRAHAVVELPAGTLARSATERGDRIVVVPRSSPSV